MSNKFKEFLDEIDAEASAEGTQAVAELALFDERYKLAHELIGRRRQLKLTQSKLARISGIGQAEISKIEGGRSNPTLDTLSALAHALKCELSLTPIPAK